MGKFIEQPGWLAALDNLEEARTILLLGGTDTGKTTFLTWLANRFVARQRRIAIVDADVGQSSVGPPTTIGLGLVAEPLQSLQDLSPAALYFVGSTSPRGHLLPVTVGTKRLVDRARRLGVDQIMIDTCGYISADGGQVLKYYQIDLVNPEVVVCLQRAQECEPILQAFRDRQQPRILRLWASPGLRRRTTEERRQHREQALRRYFGRPQIVTLSWDDLNLFEAPIGSGAALEVESHSHLGPSQVSGVLWVERRDGELQIVLQSPPSSEARAELARAVGSRIRIWLAGELHGTLLGLLNKVGEAVGIGILQHIDYANRRFDVLTAEGITGIRGVHWSRTRMGPSGDLQRVLYTTL